MTFSTIIGFAAALFTTTAFVPQTIKIIKTKSTKDISLLMYLVMWIGTLLWLIYGFILKELPMIAANIISNSLITAVLILKIRYK